MDTRDGGPSQAAFGLRFEGLDAGALLAVTGAGAGDLVPVTVAYERGGRTLPDRFPTPDWARLPVAGGEVHVDRTRGRVTMRAPERPTGDEAVHPWLGCVAIAYAGWRRQQLLHGGAFVVDGGAWAVLGERWSGKSTLLGRLATYAHAEVLADDTTVLDGGDVLPGPRCVDLRPGAVEAVVGSETARTLAEPRPGRPRLLLPPAAARTPLRGIVYLREGPGPAISRVPVAQRIERLRRHAPGPLVPIDDHVLLDLVALPTLELSRPRDLALLDAGVALLLDAAG